MFGDERYTPVGPRVEKTARHGMVWSRAVRKKGRNAARLRATADGRAKALINAARERAAKKGLAFDVDWQDVARTIAAGHCEATALPFDLVASGGGFMPRSPSLDRIKPSLGYVKGNVRVVVTQFNLAKSKWTDVEFAEIARAFLVKHDAPLE